MRYKVKTTVSFEAAHRLYSVDTFSEECRDNVHGHSYKVTFVIGTMSLNSAGMVIDFKLLKKIIKETIEDKFDHSCILKSNDPILPCLRENCKKVIVTEENPTAEWMSEYFCKQLQKELSLISNLKVLSCEVQETENNIAIYEPGGDTTC